MSHTPTTHPSLLLRLSDAADHQAWVQFVTLYEPVIYRSLRRHGLQDADARDVMQDMLLIVSRNIDRFEPRKEHGSFRAWLRRVTRNLVIHWLKRRQRDGKSADRHELQSLLESSPAGQDADTIEFDLEVRRALFHRAAEQVRIEVQEATWDAFWKTAVQGKTAAEAAAQLGLTMGAVRVARCRVLARVRTTIARWENES